MAINPFITNIFFDSCAFDPKYGDEASASEVLLTTEGLKIIISHSTLKETSHPNTPDKVKVLAKERMFTLPVGLTPDEIYRKSRILEILTGNGNPSKMRQDSEHVFEASKYGSYFVTTDNRILKKKEELKSIGVVCSILLPNELLKLVKQYTK